MGISMYKRPVTETRPSVDGSADPFLATCSRIEFYEAELLVRAYNTAWYGEQSSSSSRHGHSNCSPPTTPLYDSDDEPTEPSGVVNALAANSPPPGQQYRERSFRTPSPLPMLRSLSEPPAPSNTDPTSLQFYPAAAQQYLPHKSTASAHGSKHRRTHSSSTKHQPAPQKMRSSADALPSHVKHLPGKPGGANGQNVICPLSSAIIAAAAAGADSSALQHLSLVSNQGSAADLKFRPYHHLHMMQQRRAQQRHHQQQHPVMAACAHAQTQCVRGWANVSPAGATEV